jgi:hypothetical protein
MSELESKCSPSLKNDVSILIIDYSTLNRRRFFSYVSLFYRTSYRHTIVCTLKIDLRETATAFDSCKLQSIMILDFLEN